MELQTFYKDWKLLFYSVDRSCVKLYVQSQQKSNLCPSCNMPSSRVHSRYWRVIQDVTILSLQVFLHVRARKFFCDHSACSQRIFTERTPDWWSPYARRTSRLTAFLKHLAFTLSAETASKVSKQYVILRKYPSIQIVTRDSSTEYGIREGCPHAVQMTDRWHLFHNLTQKVEQFLKKSFPRHISISITKSDDYRPSKQECHSLTASEKKKLEFVLGDAAYDSEKVRQTAEQAGILFMFPINRRNSKERKDAYDWVLPVLLKTRFGQWLFGLRREIERVFNELKSNGMEQPRWYGFHRYLLHVLCCILMHNFEFLL